MTEPRSPALASELSGPALLRLARSDREAARARLRALDIQAQAHACRELRPEVRSEFLMLLDHPETVVPLLPETELCITIRAGGMSEGAWLLELATQEQLRACFDLDCWNGDQLELARVGEWIEALIEAGRPVLVRALQETDLELWVLALREITEVMVLGKEDEPPVGWFTLDGVAYFGAHEDVDPARVREIMAAAFDAAPREYWLLVYGALFELPADCQEWALRWRSARLKDLGFPDREQAMQAYRPLQPKEVEAWEPSEAAAAIVPSLEVPERLRGTLLGRALVELPPERAQDVLGYVLGVVNSIAVADRLSLSDPDSIPRALEKAVRGIEVGLRELATLHGSPVHEVLDRTRPLDLFRVGATLDRALRGDYR